MKSSGAKAAQNCPRTLHWARLVQGALLVYLALTGCASYKAARPTYVCGTMVASGGPGVAIIDAWPDSFGDEPSAVPTGPLDARAWSLVRVSNSCKTGATVTLPSGGGFRLAPVARAKDGRPVVFGVQLTSDRPAEDVPLTVSNGHAVRVVHMLAYYAGPAGDGVFSSPAPARSSS